VIKTSQLLTGGVSLLEVKFAYEGHRVKVKVTVAENRTLFAYAVQHRTCAGLYTHERREQTACPCVMLARVVDLSVTGNLAHDSNTV